MTTDIIISVRGLEKHFNEGQLKALRGVDADIKRGEVVVVIGPSGSGKSTFLRCLNLLEEPTKGTVTVEGVNITDPKVNINKHREKMGMVFQHFNLFPHMTILKNMTLAPRKLLKKSKAEAEEKALTLLKRVGLADRANAYPSQLSVIIRDMAHIGATLDQATAAGANNIYNIEFLSTKAAEAQDEATAYAVQDAMRKARLLADAANLELGGILSITESTGGFYGTVRTFDSKLAAAGNSILPDDTSVTASVTMVFEIK